MKHGLRWLVFALVAVAQFMVVLDVSITNVALPAIRQSLHFSNSTLQWVVTGYTLTFGGFLMLGGRAADWFGRRRTLLGGILFFTAFSLLISLSRSSTTLIVFRALQGASAAFMSPSALSIVLTTFREGSERNKALGYWTLIATGGSAAGMLLGGVFTEYWGWRSNFLVNVPVGVLVSIAIMKIVPPHKREGAYQGFDLSGAVLLTTSLIAFVVGFSEAPVWGWRGIPTLAILTFAISLMAAFLFNESLSKHPLVPLSILRARNVAGANLMMAPLYASVLGTFFLMTLFEQAVLHYSPARAGLSFLPFPIVLGFMSTRIPRLVSQFGYRRFLIVGPLAVSVALIWFSRLTINSTYLADVLPPFILLSAGVGVTVMPVISTATSGVPKEQSGLASGLISTSQQMGGAVGLAVISSAASSATTSIAGLSARDTLAYGYSHAFLVGATFMLCAMLIAIIAIKQPGIKNAQPAQPLESPVKVAEETALQR